MRNILIGIAALVLLAGAVHSSGEEFKKVVYLTGWVVDDEYGKKHANAESAEEVLKSHDRGFPLAFYSTERDETFRLVDQKRALKYVGEEVTILGFIDGEGKLTVHGYVPKGTKNQVIGGPESEEDE
jgi:hypothetical protein